MGVRTCPVNDRSPDASEQASVSRLILGWDTNVRLSLCLIQRLYFELSFSRPALSSTHSYLKPQEAHRHRVTKTALMMLRPTGMLLPAP